MRVSGLLLFLAACTVACEGSGSAPDPEDEPFRLVEENGVVVATTRGGAVYAGNVFTFEPVIVLQQNPGRPDSLLFNPVDFTVGSDSSYYVLDRGNARIAVFDANGQYERAFGRSGQGPGEFDGRIALQSLVGDELSIWQFQAQHTSRFRTDGTFLEEISLSVGGRLVGLDRAPEGNLVAVRSNLKPTDDPSLSSWRLEVLDPAGEVVLAEIATGSVRNTTTQQVDTGGGMATLSTSIPFTASPSVQHVPGRGILVTDGDKPELLWYDLEGELSRKVTIDIAPRRLTEALIGEWEERQQQRRGSATITTGAGTRRIALPDPVYPDFVAFWSSPLVDDRGYVWLRDVLSAHTRDDADGWMFHILDPEGRYLGMAELPAERPQIRGGRLMAMIEDPESGDVLPTVFAIRPGDAGVEYPGSYRPQVGR